MTSTEPFWLERIPHRGCAAFNPDKSYQVFRNVKDFGARGDGVTDDTRAIALAMASGNRCGGGNQESTTIAPAIVYFPSGIYLVSAPIIAYYYTQIIGDACNPPTILASPSFSGMAVIDADPYIPGGHGRQWYTNQNNFFRSVRNIVIDLRRMPEYASATGLHWQVSQATSLQNIRVEMSTVPGNRHQGMFMENGSGGFMGDLTFNGGNYGMWLGNQQFTVRNVTISNAHTGIWAQWNWGWTFQGIHFKDCQVGFDLVTGGHTAKDQGVGAEAIIDSSATNVSYFLRTSKPSKVRMTGSLVLQNIDLRNCTHAVSVKDGATILPGGNYRISRWGQGHVYTGTDPEPKFVIGELPGSPIAAELLDEHGRVWTKSRPQYEGLDVSQIISVKDKGAAGDGVTDDTRVLQEIIDKYAASHLLFFDHGAYLITDTLYIPPHARIVGEVWSVILGSGNAFLDQDEPRVMVQIGKEGDEGMVEITDILFATRGPTPGAIVVQWNVRDLVGSRGGGMWDTHIRLGGADGTNLIGSDFRKGKISSSAFAAFLALHLTKRSSVYLEGTWVWLADHELDGDGKSQLTLFSGRGILSESQGPVWMIGTGSEHHILYQYMLRSAKKHFMGLIQTESPYFQPNPPAPAPFRNNTDYGDPVTKRSSAWGLWVEDSHEIVVFGAGLYSFFSDYSQVCLDTASCQSHILNIDSASSVDIYSLSTVGTTWQLSIDQKGIVNEVKNPNGFAATATCWTRNI